jgi:hypothetical protein
MGTRQEHETAVLPKPAEDESKDKYIESVAARLRSSPPPPLDVRRQLKLQEKKQPKAKAQKPGCKAKAKAKCKGKAKAAAKASAERKKVANKLPECASAGSDASLGASESDRLSSRVSKLEGDLEALKAIHALDIANILGEGKMSCTVLVALDGRVGVGRKEAFFRVNVNLAKRSFWIYGGEDAAGFTMPKRNHSWATTSPAEAWQSALDVMKPWFNSGEPKTKKAKKSK